MKIKKTKKSKRFRGKNMGTHGGGARKNRKGSGHKGGIGMSGSGKRADHKKTLVTKKYGSGYFGKKGITSKKTQRDKRQRVNLGQIQENLQTYLKKGLAKKTSEGFEINLKNYKILGKGEVKDVLIINAKEVSKSCVDKIKKAKGKIIFPEKKVKVSQEIKSEKSAPKEIAKKAK